MKRNIVPVQNSQSIVKVKKWHGKRHEINETTLVTIWKIVLRNTFNVNTYIPKTRLTPCRFSWTLFCLLPARSCHPEKDHRNASKALHRRHVPTLIYRRIYILHAIFSPCQPCCTSSLFVASSLFFFPFHFLSLRFFLHYFD